ncbi:MAG: cytochrome P450 [Pseudomonadales bacterium]|nr:cytochrome P450 [Pseudomonadales bacterium]MCP5172180.1 cytochrome P450 [Pseudomonadales bacterium]
MTATAAMRESLNPIAEKPAYIPDEMVVDFDIYNPPNLQQGFHDAWKQLHAEGVPDVVWTPYNGGHWLTCRFKPVEEVLSNYETFSSRCILVPKERGEEYHILPTHLSPPEHRPYRALLNAGLSPKRISQMRSEIETTVAKLIEGVREQGECCFTSDIAAPFPTRIIMLILGLPPEDGPYLKQYADQVMRPDGTMAVKDAEAKILEYLTPAIASRRLNPRDDMISHMVNAEIDGQPLPDDHAYQLCVEVIIAGLDTIVNFMNFAMLYLAENPEQRRRLIENPDLIPAAADEFVRRYGLVVVGRYVEKDVSFYGAEMKAGDMVINATFLPALDDRVNPDPMNVDFDRKNVEHVTFGAGPHRCAGAPLARVEIIAALTAWLSRIPDFDVKPGAVPNFKAGTVGSMEDLYLVWDPATTRSIPVE